MPVLVPMAGVKLVLVAFGNIADRLQPVIDDAMRIAIHRRVDAAAAIMTANDHMLDVQHADGEFQHG